MTASRQRRPAPAPGAGAVAAGVTDGPGHDEIPLCTCCDPRNPLVLRPDLGVLGDGSAEFALCVLNGAEPVVYRNRGDGEYVHVPGFSLSPAGEIIDERGDVVARVAGDGFQRLSTVDDDDQPGDRDPGGGPGRDRDPGGASRPRTVHVDLSQDDFYVHAGAAPRSRRT